MDDDVIIQAWLKDKQIEVLKSGSPQKLAFDAAAFAEVAAQMAELTAKHAAMFEAKQAAEMDTARLTPPRQQGSDGGPQQVPTVGGTGGALTPSQEEHGRQEPPTGATKVSTTVAAVGAPGAPPPAPPAPPPKTAAKG